MCTEFASGNRDLAARGGITVCDSSAGAVLVGGVTWTDLMEKQQAPFLGRWFF